MERGKLIVISGFSGVGKGTVIGELRKKDPSFRFSVSATTRYRREGETDGVEYFFISREEFETGIEAGRFLEYTTYSGNYYGTPVDAILSQMERGETVILDIECEGAMNVRRRIPEALLIYMIPPGAEELCARLLGRGQETEEQIKKRLERAVAECDVIPEYDGIIVNFSVAECVKELQEMIRDPEHLKRGYEKNLPQVPRIREDLKRILKNWEQA